MRAAFAADGYLEANSDFIDYAIEDYPVRLIAVDTLNTGSNKGDFCPERARRLIDLIDAEPAKAISVLRTIRRSRCPWVPTLSTLKRLR